MPTKLLVVDDEPDVELLIRQRFRRQIRRREFEFEFALNGREALERLEEFPEIAVVITDLNMPEVDGLSLLQRLRERPGAPPTVVVTAYGDMKNIRGAMNRGAVDFLTKPIDFEDLELTLRKAIELSESAQAAQRAQQEKIEAEAANAAKSMFVASISHEIRNPMNSIVGMCSLLVESELGEEQRLYADHLNASCEALLGLLDDVLDLSRIEAGALSLAREPFELRQVTRQVVSILSQELKRKAVALEVTFGRELPERILGDAGRLRQVLLNLLSNACKFTDAGRIELELGLGEGEVPELLVTIRDTGIGIPAERRQAIFGAYAQAEPTTARRFGGSGLGLAICERIVRAWGGAIGVESEPGVGSTFWFTHPLVACPSEDPSLPRVPPPPLRPLRVLLADDSHDNRFLIGRFLLGTSHSLSEVEDGRAALARLEAETFDLILLDMDMPVLDGFETARALRARELRDGLPRTPILALTAYALAEERERCLSAGCDVHLAKPITKAQLLDALARCAERPEPIEVRLDPEIADLVPGYLAARREDARLLQAAAQAGEWDQARRIGHTIRGTGGSYGFPRLTEIGEDLQAAALAQDGEGIAVGASALLDFLTRIRPRYE